RPFSSVPNVTPAQRSSRPSASSAASHGSSMGRKAIPRRRLGWLARSSARPLLTSSAQSRRSRSGWLARNSPGGTATRPPSRPSASRRATSAETSTILPRGTRASPTRSFWPSTARPNAPSRAAATTAGGTRCMWLSQPQRRSVPTSPTSLPGVLVVVVPGGPLRVVRPVVDLEEHGRLFGDGGPVHPALGVPVEAPRRERRARGDVAVAPREAVHELVRGVGVRVGYAGALLEPHERDRGARLLVAPQHLLREAGQGLGRPLQVLGLGPHFPDGGTTVGRERRGRRRRGGGDDPRRVRWAGLASAPACRSRSDGLGAGRRSGLRGPPQRKEALGSPPADLLE